MKVVSVLSEGNEMRKVHSFGSKLENSESMKRYVAVDRVVDPSLFGFLFFVSSHSTKLVLTRIILAFL